MLPPTQSLPTTCKFHESEVFYKKGAVSQNSQEITFLCRSLFFSKVVGLRTVTL